MFPRIQGLFFTIADKRSQPNRCDDNNVTLMSDMKIEDDSSDVSSSENVDIEANELMAVDAPSSEPTEDHASECTCHNCIEVLSRFAECSICLEPLQCAGPCACPSCGGFWCTRCSRRMIKCAWCRGSLRSPTAPCVTLQRLVNDLMLPCRNSKRGCTELLTASSRPKHEIVCKFDTMVCPIIANCGSLPFEELSAHIQSTHNIIAVYSQKIKILIENFPSKLKKTAYCKTKYKIVLLHEKSAFIIKICIHNYNVKVEIMRKKLGPIVDAKADNKKSEYCALVEFQGKAFNNKSVLVIENESYAKKAEMQWNEEETKSENDESITIHVNIGKYGYK
ncbi:uncharacterized protein LOC106133298 [Amyelois transitella]|uniref:uncharacterized protein LOC106133298 n=1 Tax=Amyelois transitella TaxID=680683 RepID=UPI00067D7210|nr:uncharacterized protein LOC106133298 [Amyelois transitella]